MDAANSTRIPPPDRELMRRLTLGLAYVFLFTVAFSSLHRLYSKKFFDLTGRAQWIWPWHQVSSQRPVVFFAAHDFDLPPWRKYARIKILGDPEYTLYFNGNPVGGRRVRDDRHLDLYEVSDLARDGRNRVLVTVRSSNGVGGLIAGIDITPEAENIVATSGRWKIFRAWSDALPFRDAGKAEPPMLIGQPPAGKWNYLSPRQAPRTTPPRDVIVPRAVFPFRAHLGVIRILEGVPVAGKKPVHATVYDFGPVAGRVRLTLIGRNAVAPLVNVRLANALDELQLEDHAPRPFPFAPGEHTVTDPDVAHFRYVVVYGGRARAEVVK